MVDVLIIGSGGAGLTAALSAKEAGASVLVVGKTRNVNFYIMSFSVARYFLTIVSFPTNSKSTRF